MTMTKIPVAKVKDNFSNILRRAGKEEIVVTVHGRPVAVIIGFENEDDWLECRLFRDSKPEEDLVKPPTLWGKSR